jgi:MFS family permease
MSNLFPKQKIEGILALVGGFSLHLTLGTLYCFGNMSTYMTSYLRKHVDPDITYSDMIWIPTLSTIGQGVFMTLSGHLEERIGVRFTLLVGSSIMTAGVYLTAFTIRLSTFLTIFTYGFMFGLGTALAYAPPLAVAMRWFPRQKGLVNGVIVGGFGLGAFVFNQIQSIYLNPNNEALDSDGFFSDDVILNRVPSVFLLLGSIYGIIQAMAILLISTPSSSDETSMLALVPHDAEEESEEDDVDALEDEDDELFHQQQAQPGEEVMRLHGSMNNGDSGRRAAAGVNVTLGNAQDAENLKPSQVVKSREFWTLWLTFFLNTQAITYINSMYKAYGQTFINDDHFLSIVGALAAIFNASGR